MDDDWTPLADRRAFLSAVGAACTAGMAGCSGDGGDGDGNSGGDGSGGGPGGSASPAGDGSDGLPRDHDSVDPTANPRMPADRGDFALPMDRAESSFDATIREDVQVFDAGNMDAVVDGAPGEGYVVDEGALDRQLQSGDTLLLSGVDLCTVTAVERDGDTATVEIEPASLDQAIEDGHLQWTAQLGTDFAHSPEDENREVLGATEADQISRPPGPGAGGTGGGGGTAPGGDGTMYFTGVEMVGESGSEPVPLSAMQASGDSLEWRFTAGGREFAFRAEKDADGSTTIRAQVTQPAGGDATLAFTAEGSVGEMEASGDVEYEDSDLQAAEFRQNDVSADFELSMSAAGSQDGDIDWEFPGIMFKYVVFVGPVPVTLSFSTQVIGSITVPDVDGSATGTSRFEYAADTGFQYQGTDVDLDASVGDQPLLPEESDAAANIGQPVDLQFGIAYPRLEISVFEQALIPYIQFGMIIGSRLDWGPVCKTGYVRMVILAGYDFEVLGQSLASEQVTLFEDTERSEGDSCE